MQVRLYINRSPCLIVGKEWVGGFLECFSLPNLFASSNGSESQSEEINFPEDNQKN
ncbi:uncharacterized protein METZ01_LOCUS190767 [marine metagenome]|uniref:Uncharacterized protein n=1 Tax=marine metagenome TaxID=408172 RepID=A0A382DJX2_9ZZZZ